VSARIVSFDWDETNVQHLARHGVMKEEVMEAFLDPYSDRGDTRWERGESRYTMIGETGSGRPLTVVFAIREGCIRPVTAYTPKAGVASNN
jgi:uncharacterized protein